MKLKKQSIVKLIMVLGILISSYSYTIAQTTDEDEDYQESYENAERSSFFNDMNESRFKSSFSEVEESEKIDYSRTRAIRERNELSIFGEANNANQYQFKDDNALNQQTNQTNRVIISSGSGTWNQVPSVNQTPNSITPTVTNPFGANPGVKTPRNMDAVPDNGDDPNDVPLDGGILILGLAAMSLGYKKVKSEN